MEHCATCTHWQPPSGGVGSLPAAGRCGAVAYFWDSVTHAPGGMYLELTPNSSTRLAFASDEGQHAAVLLTMPEFGCVQHQPGPAAAP